MGKRIVGYVISHSGKPGGPWEADYGDNGQPTEDPKHRLECISRHTDAQHTLDRVREVHPAARILRLVRRERHRAEEAAVVEAAMVFVAAPVFDMAVMFDLTTACAALRAKRGG
jgi:hypothetical protein